MKRMKIGFINVYRVDEPLAERHGDYPSIMARLLQNAAPTSATSSPPQFTWQTYEAREGQLPQTADECDGYLIGGSRCAAYEDWDWLPPLFDCIRMLHNAKRPLAGICFGHQAVAKALGGEVEKSANGWGVGTHQWNIVGDAKWMRPKLSCLRLLVSHQDQVVALPPDAALLAASDFCPNAMYAIGGHIFCAQGHPEFTAEFARELLADRSDRMPPEVWQAGMDSANWPNDSAVFGRWLAAFFAGGRAVL